MDKITYDFYTGYEGEGEIQFIHEFKNGDRGIIRIWDGYFDDIMTKIEPEADGWTGLAYYYNLIGGWYDESPWEIPNLNVSLKQLEQIAPQCLEFEKSKKALSKICEMLTVAIKQDEKVLIAEE